MLGKLNIWKIIRDHFSTFTNYRTGRVSISDYLLFLGIPLALAVIAVWRNITFPSAVLSAMLSAFSIFAGLLLNLLLLICNFANNQRFAGSDPATAMRRTFLKQVYFNLAFSIILAICIVAVTLVSLSFASHQEQATHPIATVLLSFLVSQFVLTLFMILQRIHTLLSFEFERPSLKKSA